MSTDDTTEKPNSAVARALAQTGEPGAVATAAAFAAQGLLAGGAAEHALSKSFFSAPEMGAVAQALDAALKVNAPAMRAFESTKFAESFASTFATADTISKYLAQQDSAVSRALEGVTAVSKFYDQQNAEQLDIIKRISSDALAALDMGKFAKSVSAHSFKIPSVEVPSLFAGDLPRSRPVLPALTARQELEVLAPEDEEVEAVLEVDDDEVTEVAEAAVIVAQRYTVEMVIDAMKVALPQPQTMSIRETRLWLAGGIIFAVFGIAVAVYFGVQAL